MTALILDNMVTEVAKAMAGASYVYPAYGAVTTSTVTVLATNTALPSEKGARFALSATRAGAEVLYSGIRSGTVVTTSVGDAIVGTATFNALTTGTELTEASIPVITQTTNFDIEFNWNVAFQRPSIWH